MGREIERKFLVKSKEYKKLAEPIMYKQGYLSTDINSIVRVRIYNEEAYLTVKGKPKNLERPEFEYKIPLNEAEEMLYNLCRKPIIEKYRYKYLYRGFMWEVDEFLGENSGLVIAEIELEAENTHFDKPDWIGQEVSNDYRYATSNLIENPYKNWRKDLIN